GARPERRRFLSLCRPERPGERHPHFPRDGRCGVERARLVGLRHALRSRAVEAAVIAVAVPLAHLEQAWPHLWPLLEPALQRSPDKPAACADGEAWLLARLRGHDVQLWAVHADGRPVAAVVTE